MVLAASGLVAAADERALVRIESVGGDDRNALIAAGVALVAELDGAFHAVGEPTLIGARAGLRPVRVLDRGADSYALAQLRPGWTNDELAACGRVLAVENNVAVLAAPRFDVTPCTASPHWLLSRVSMRPLAPSRPVPERFVAFTSRLAAPLETDARVQAMVDSVTPSRVLEIWDGIINGASTRYSTSAGCRTAADAVAATLRGFGLEVQRQNHTSGHAANVIATLPGTVTPGHVYIVIAHLDDMPSAGLAPGADDNASGTALVVALAEAMSPYVFASTVKFIAVTGEEFGLYGSEYYAADAAARGEDVQGVLDADMVGWQGDSPGDEDLVVDVDAASQWLGNLLTQAAQDYGTGCRVVTVLCPSMRASDHAPFWVEGWAALCGITDNEGACGRVGHYPYYHTSNDTRAACGEPAFFVSVVKAYLATLAHMAEPQCPRPSPPTGLAVAFLEGGGVEVSWTAAGPGLSYVIRRASGGCNWASGWADAGETDATTWADTAASAGSAFSYVVVSRDPTTGCVSRLSACAEVPPGASNPPPAPSGLTGTAASTTSAALAWTDNAANETGIKVERRFGSFGAWTRIATLGANATSHLDAGLLAGRSYSYRVRATNPAGDSPASNEVTVSLSSSGGAPAAPSNLGATAVSSSQINLSWTDNSANETGFKIERKKSTALSYTQITTVGANVTSYQSTGLSASTAYTYRVRATNASGNSSYSNTATATTTSGSGSVPAAPTALAAVAASSSQINLSWTDNASDETGFKIERKTGSGSYAQIGTVGANVTAYQSTGLSASTAYTYRVRATNASGDSGYSNEASATTQAGSGSAPAAPSSLTATSASSSQINLSWTDNASDETGFKIERKTGSGSYAQIATVGANVTSYQSAGLSASTTYTYRVRATNASGDSAYSNEASAMTKFVLGGDR